MKKWRAAVIGLGNIGMGYDYSDDGTNYILTHTQAFQSHPDFELVGAVDTQASARDRFTKKFSRLAFATLEELIKDTREPIDVLSVATPSPLHKESFFAALRAKPKLILCEKPLAPTLEDAREMIRAANEVDCLVTVNYMRRFEPAVNEVKRLIDKGTLGEIYKGNVWYTKGLVNNASHFIDLLHYWLGPSQRIEVIRQGRDLTTGDAEPDFQALFGKTEVTFFAAREECFSFYELMLVGEKGRIRYIGEGQTVEWQAVGPDPDYPGYTTLGLPQYIQGDTKKILWHVVDRLQAQLSGQKPNNISGLESAMASLETVHDILKKRRSTKE